MYGSWKESQLDTYYLLALCHRNVVHLYSLDVEEGAKKTFAVPSLTKLAELNRHEITAICSVTKAEISKHMHFMYSINRYIFLQSIESRLKINFHIRFLKSWWWNQKKSPFAFPNKILIQILQWLFKNSVLVCFRNPQDKISTFLASKL